VTTGWGANANARPGPGRWLLLPLAAALFALLGLAISTEDRDEFQERTSTAAARPRPATADDSRAVPVGAATSTPATSAPATSTPATIANRQPAPGIGEQSGQRVSFEVTAPSGRLGVQLGGAQPLAVPSGTNGGGLPELLTDGTGSGTGAPGTPTVSGDPADPAATVGLRLTSEGRLEPVTQGQIKPGDLVVTPAAGGLDLIRANGTRVQVRPDASASGIAASEVSPAGVNPLQPDGRGEIALADGVTIRVPQTQPHDTPITPTSAWARLRSSWWRWLALAAAAVLVAATTAIVLRRRRRPRTTGEGLGPLGRPGAGVPAHRFEQFLATLAADPDPGRAIRLAFAAAERGLGRLPARHSTETPFEWYRRVAPVHPQLAEPLAGLCACFANTRFAPAAPTSAERDAAVGELRRLFTDGDAHHHGAAKPAARAEVGVGV
jgi:hypothetical protein